MAWSASNAGERGRITPKVTLARIELDLPVTLSRKAN